MNTQSNIVIGAIELADFHLALNEKNNISEEDIIKLRDTFNLHGRLDGVAEMSDEYILNYILESVIANHTRLVGEDHRNDFIISMKNTCKVLSIPNNDVWLKLYNFKVNISNEIESLTTKQVIQELEGFVFDLDIIDQKTPLYVMLMRNYLFFPEENMEKISNLSTKLKELI
jgi:hypothetical protein